MADDNLQRMKTLDDSWNAQDWAACLRGDMPPRRLELVPPSCPRHAMLARLQWIRWPERALRQWQSPRGDLASSPQIVADRSTHQAIALANLRVLFHVRGRYAEGSDEIVSPRAHGSVGALGRTTAASGVIV